MSSFIDIVLHLDVHLAQWSAYWGVWIYVILFLIIFAETGLVIAPFLPGDSLLFAVGALATLEGSGLKIEIIWMLLIGAAFLGDNTNYQIGKFLGPKIFSKPKSLFLNPNNLQKTHDFYAKYGNKTVLLARFLPLFRTFVPFVAGVGRMNYPQFVMFSLSGSFLWMSSFLGAGYFFGNIPSVKTNFHIVILALIGITLLPIVFGVIRSKFPAK